MESTRGATRSMTATWNSGMTLLEVCIACAILGLAFVYLFGSILSFSALNGQTRERAVAQSQVSSILAALQPLDRQQLLAFSPPAIQGLGASATVQVACLNHDGDAVALPAAPDATLPNPAEVRVTLRWRDPQGRTSSLIESALFYGR